MNLAYHRTRRSRRHLHAAGISVAFVVLAIAVAEIVAIVLR